MGLKSKFILLVLICAVSCGFSSPRETDSSTSAPNADALAMLEERFASLSGSLGKMTVPPNLSGKISLPSEIHGKIQLPGDGVITQQPSKENAS